MSRSGEFLPLAYIELIGKDVISYKTKVLNVTKEVSKYILFRIFQSKEAINFDPAEVDDFVKDGRILLERLRYLHLLSLKKGIDMTRNTNNITGIETIVKKSIKGRYSLQKKYSYDKEKKEMLEDFVTLSNNTPEINISFDECYCPESSAANDEIEDPYSYRTMKYTCARTGKISRGLNIHQIMMRRENMSIRYELKDSSMDVN